MEQLRYVLKSKPASVNQLYEKLYSPDLDLFGDERTEYSRDEVKEALKIEANRQFGIVIAGKKGRLVTYRMRPQQKARAGKPETDTEDTKKVGKAGEYLVLSELLFRGYEANIMSVDDGIDIVASKDNKLYFVQVKTTYMDNKKVNVSIPVETFDRVKMHDVTYFIVVREGYGNARILMFHQSEIASQASNGYIDKSNANYNIKIDFSGGVPELYNSKGDRTKINAATQEVHKFNI